MSLAPPPERLQLPETLRDQLFDYRRRVWSIKMIEAVAAAIFGLLVAFLLMFLIDRVWDTPASIRLLLFVSAWVGAAVVPLAFYRWVWRNRRLEQLARLLGRGQPQIGDQLLGVIELVRSDAEQARSRALCAAAIQQVAQDASRRDFRAAVPHPRHRLWGWLVGAGVACSLGLLAACPDAATNAWRRLLAPWSNTPRYTFAAVQPLPGTMVVAHGEPFSVAARLGAKTAWRPREGVVQLGEQHPVTAPLKDSQYEFELPSQIDPGWLDVRIGDSAQRVRVEPTLRPELTSVIADVTLPDYLGRSCTQQKDVRGGAISLVKGSTASFTAIASRDLKTAAVDGQERRPQGARVSSPATRIEGTRTMEFRWQDDLGLAGRAPFLLAINGRDDEAPSMSCENLPRQKVVLDSETLQFKVKAQDDFGVKRIGMEWQGVENAVVKTPAKGERILAAGGNDKELLEITGTFTARSLGIEPQPVNVRIFTEDYFPGRGRVYSPAYLLYVLNAEQHAIWLTEQLSRWHRQSLEVRDRELQLYETNKQLRALSPDELDKPEVRRRIENQAVAERTNGRRLTNLVGTGEDLVQQAMRNPEFAVAHLEKWAEMLQILKDIAANRMPSVADLLKQASQSPLAAAATPSAKRPMAGMVRDTRSGSRPSDPKDAKKAPAAVPLVVDRESSQQPPDKNAGQPAPPKPASQPRLTLPLTTLAGKSGDGQPPAPTEQKMEEAVTKQQDLLAEFEKIADELNRVLANLEGSTLVKRLKAASRMQYSIAGRMIDQVRDAFGLSAPRAPDGAAKVIGELAEQESKGSHGVSVIMDDMQSYFERRRFVQFKTVLDEMRKLDVIGNLRQLGDDLKKENGLSIAQCEYWSDTLDRWAEDLVDPACSGTCQAKSRSSLPPALVLEVLLILEGEVNLREETRVGEQARTALSAADYDRQAQQLSKSQDGLKVRLDKVNDQIRQLPDAESEFAYEMSLLGKVADVMNEATGILARPETGSEAIAAETEAIELLLRSRRINPRGGGGGGANPGGGGTGKTIDSAMALLGSGVNQKEVREDRGVSQVTGETGPVLPEEFRAGLDEYFNRLERNAGGQ